MLMPATITVVSFDGAMPTSTQPPARRPSPAREPVHSENRGTALLFRASQRPVWLFAIRSVVTRQRSVSSFSSPHTQEKPD